jgi:hypothetical protein
MQLYQFEVLRGEDVIAVEPSVPLYNTKAAWPKATPNNSRFGI